MESSTVFWLDSSPSTDASAFNISSPTLTADTLSTSGFNSPDRLSQQYALGSYRTNKEPMVIEEAHEALSRSVRTVTDQLYYLHAGEESVYATPRTHPFVDDYFLTPTNLLADPAASSSQITLKKLPTISSTTPSSLALTPSKSSDLRKDSFNEDSSLSDDIFGELSYLTYAIN